MAEDKQKIFEKIAKKILPKDYELSVVFASDKLALSLNKQYRKKDYIPNVLSFPYSKKSGEIFLNLKQIKKDAKKFGITEKECEKYMLIHALLHLKGLKHSAKMNEQERKFLKLLKISLPLHLKTNGKKKYSGRN